jgi:hypothetical protein
MNIFSRSALCGAFACLPLSAFACASCGCTLNGDWESQGFAARPGFRIDLRYDYLNQSQLRTGSGTVNRGAVTFPAEREIEQGTINRYTTLGLDYSPSADWGVNVQLPYVDRPHTTVSGGDVDISSSHTQGIGDMRLIGRYQGFSEQRNYGVQFGLKLPTGGYRTNFNGGPQAGQPLDRGLQAGSGTTDLLLGAYFVNGLTDELDFYTQAIIQAPLTSKDAYRPGVSLNANLGVRYVASETVTPELQINARTVRRDRGANADIENSGGTLVYLSPGATVSISQNIKVFGFVQVPIYQRVNGYQLSPRYTASVGARYVF